MDTKISKSRVQDFRPYSLSLRHDGKVHLRVADERDSCQLWSVAVNIVSKQFPIADKGWSSSLDVGQGVNSSPLWKTSFLQYVTQGLGLGEPLWTWLWTFGFHKRQAISWLAEWLSAFQEGPCSMELVYYKTWGLHDDEDSSRCLLGYDTV
jgi:hypothetical protein